MEKEPFDLINIRNQWKLAGFRDFRVSRVGQRNECMLVLKMRPRKPKAVYNITWIKVYLFQDFNLIIQPT